jgi:hypothetical protein
MAKTTEADHSRRYNHDDDLRPDVPGRPPRPATEPAGSEGSSRTGKTATDPATGETTASPEAPKRP